MRMFRLVRAAVCMTAVSACTSFGASKEPDRDTSDAAAPSSPQDAAPQNDAGVVTGSFCAEHVGPNVVFCDDFEGTTPLYSAERWSDGYPENDSVAVVDAVASGRSRVLRAQVSFPAGDRSTWLRKELTPSAKVPAERSRYRLSFSFAVTESDISYAAIGALWFNVNPNQASSLHGAAVVASGAQTRPTDPSTAQPRALAGGWHTAVITLVKGAASWMREVAIDGQSFSTENALGIEASHQVDVRLGVFYAYDDAGHVDVSFDDVLVEAF